MADRLPSLSDFAVGDVSAYPELWENCVGAWAPSLGPTGGIIPDRTGLTIPAEVVSPSAGTNYQVNDGVYCFDANVASSTYVKTNLNRNNTVTQLTWAWWGRLHSGGVFYVSDLSVTRGFGIDNLGTLIYLNYPGAANYAQIGIDVRGRWVHYGYVFNGNGSTDAERIKFYIDGTERTLTYIGATPTSLLTTTEPLQIGRRPYSVTQSPGLWDDFRAYSTALDPATIRLLASRRGIAYTPRKRVYAINQAAGAFTLAADGGTYSYSGNNANLLFNRKVQADGGTYSYSGNNATLTYTTAAAFTLSADGGTFSYSGNAADFKVNRVLAAAGGTYSFTGNNATIRYSGAAGGGATPEEIWAYEIIPGVSAGAMLLQIYQLVDVAVSSRPSASDVATAVLLAAEVSPIKADIRKVNNYTVKGSGTETDPWHPA